MSKPKSQNEDIKRRLLEQIDDPVTHEFFFMLSMNVFYRNLVLMF